MVSAPCSAAVTTVHNARTASTPRKDAVDSCVQVSSLAAVIEARATPKAGEAPRPPPLPRTASLGASGGGLDPPPRLHVGKLGADRKCSKRLIRLFGYAGV